jgi:hypothetical protein
LIFTTPHQSYRHTSGAADTEFAIVRLKAMHQRKQSRCTMAAHSLHAADIADIAFIVPACRNMFGPSMT